MKEKHYLLRSGAKDEIIPARILERPDALKAIVSPLGFRIFQLLSSPKCPIDIARKIGEHEQKVYYHINRFRKYGLVEEVRSEKRKGKVIYYGQCICLKMLDINH
jgi:DNA-binding transcriptional ArsR family regulator